MMSQKYFPCSAIIIKDHQRSNDWSGGPGTGIYLRRWHFMESFSGLSYCLHSVTLNCCETDEELSVSVCMCIHALLIVFNLSLTLNFSFVCMQVPSSNFESAEMLWCLWQQVDALCLSETAVATDHQEGESFIGRKFRGFTAKDNSSCPILSCHMFMTPDLNALE